MNRKMRVSWCFLVMGVLILTSTLSMTCKRHDQPPVSFSATFGGGNWDDGSSVCQTADGGYIVTGSTKSYGAGFDDVWLVETDASGNSVWARTFGGANMDLGSSVQQTPDGGYIVAGTTDSYGAGFGDAWLIKTDASGNKVWDRTFGGEANDWAQSIRQTSDGGYVLTGRSGPNGGVWLLKTDASGNKAWDTAFGGGCFALGRAVRQTLDGGYIIVGCVGSPGSGDYNAWLIKTDASGNKVWDQTFGGPSGEDVGYSVQQTSDGGYIFTGYTFSSGAGFCDVWLVKTDSSGKKIWDKTFGGIGDDEGSSVQQTPDGGYIVVGLTSSSATSPRDVWLIKTDSSGNRVWDKTFGGTGDDAGNSVQQTSDGGYIVTGYTCFNGAGPADLWLIKTDAEGN